MKFHVGDRVRNICTVPLQVDMGEEGVVVGVAKDLIDPELLVMVRWDKYDDFKHNCKGRCENGHGWNMRANLLELVSPAEEDMPFEFDQSLLDELLGIMEA